MRISVCMATYNGEKYIREQIESILPQLGENDELIISDDNSTDNTIKIIEDLNDSRIKIHFNKGEKGYVPNFENAIKNSSGDIIFFSDQDDKWLPNKVTKFLERLKDNDLVVSDAIVINEYGEVIEKSLFKVVNTKKGLWNNWIKNRYYGCCMAIRREVLKRVLPFPKRYSICSHDRWIPLVCEFYYKVDLIYEPLIIYRRHGKNVSCFKKSKNSFFKKVMLRVYPLYNLLKILKRKREK